MSKTRFQCPGCKLNGEIDDEKLPDDGLRANCPRCNEKFLVKKSASFKRSMNKGNIYCPECGMGQPTSNKCVKCGNILDKYPVLSQLEFVKSQLLDKEKTCGSEVSAPNLDNKPLEEKNNIENDVEVSSPNLDSSQLEKKEQWWFLLVIMIALAAIYIITNPGSITILQLIMITQCIIFGGFCAFIAKEKNRDSTGWFFAGILFSAVALLALIAVPALPKKVANTQVNTI